VGDPLHKTGNPGAKFAIQQAMKENTELKVTLANEADEDLINSLF